VARFLADENVPWPLVKELCRLGHDVLRVQDLGGAALGMHDPDVLRTAVSMMRCVLTENAWDFVRLHSHHPTHQGIVTFTRDADATALAGRIHARVSQENELARKLIRIRRPSAGG